MKIGLVYHHFLPNIGGIEKLMLNIGTELLNKGHDLTIITTNSRESKPSTFRKIETIDGLLVKRFNILPIAGKFIAPKLMHYLLSSDFDIIHVFSYHPTFFTNLCSIISILNKKTIVTTPIYNPIRVRLSKTFFSKCGATLFEKKIGIEILKRMNYVIALSQSEENFYRLHGISKVKTIPEGIYLPKTTIETKTKFKKHYDLTDRVILSVGRIEEYKRQDLIIRAFTSVLNEYPRAKLLIIGKDWGYLPTLKKIAEDCKCEENVIFTGVLSESDLNCAYESSNVVVHASSFETFARIALEAWSHKKPIVCFDIGGPTEFIKPNMGALIKYGDIEAMSKAIIKLLSNDQQSRFIGYNGYVEVEQKYIMSRIVAEYEKVYKLARKANAYQR